MVDECKQGQGGSFRAFLLGTLFSAIVAWATVVRDNMSGAGEAYPSANLVPAFPYVVLLAAALLINPILRRIKFIRPFAFGEMLLIFLMCGTTIGVATFGLLGNVVPRISALSYSKWNTDQSEWDVHAMSSLPDGFFITADGTRALAERLRDADYRYDRARDRYRAAREVLDGREELARVKADLAEAAEIADPEARAERVQILEWPLRRTETILERALEDWDELGEGYTLEAVAENHEEEIEERLIERDGLREELKELNSGAADSVKLIREGLPDGQRAMPGFLFSKEEGGESYRARVRRYRVGTRALRQLEKADSALEAAIQSGPGTAGDWVEPMVAANDLLEPLAEAGTLEERVESVAVARKSMETRIAGVKEKQRVLRQERRYAQESQFDDFDEKLEKLDEELEDLEAEDAELTAEIDEQLQPQLDACLLAGEARTGLQALIATARGGGNVDLPALQTGLREQMATFVAFDASGRRFWMGDGEWAVWIKPLFNWLLVVVVVYMLFMTFNTLIYRQWAHNERLIYPIAEVTTLLAGSGDPESNRGPPLFRSGLFWFGFAVSAGILGWNHLAGEGIIANISPVKLESRWWSLGGSGVFSGWSAQLFSVIFVIIGLTFLVPANISYSLWFFQFLYMILLLVLVWMGYGSNRQDLGNVARGEVGMGGMLVYGLVVLWTCRHYLFCAFRPSGLSALDPGEQRELRISSILFIASSLVLVMLLIIVFKADPLLTMAFYIFALVSTIALMRAVAEGGVLGLETSGVGLGALTLVFGSKSELLAPSQMIPFAIVGAVMFGGVKAFVAASMANAFKIREEARIRRPVFHAAIWAGLGAALLAASVTLIVLSYERGANSMDGWMHTYGAESFVNGIKAQAVSDGGLANPTKRNWFFVGIILMTVLLTARQKVFGIPHPLGLIMLANPVMRGFFGSILIGWAAKAIVSKYCSKEQYVSIRGFFIGLVAGHVVAVLFGWDSMNWHWG